MPELNPLKFAVAIQDEATQKLNDLENKLNALKDRQINVTVHGIEDLRSLLQVLQHQMVNNLGNNVSQGISDALRSMQTEAQTAIRQSLSDLSANLATIKEAIQHDNFTAFGKRIGKCAEEVNNLNEAFEKFHITIGKDDGLKNFMTGLGEVIRNIRQTMGQLHGNDPGYNVTPDALSRSINVAKHETERLNTRLTETQRTIETFSDKGFNTSRLERYKSLLIDVRDNLSLIEKNGGVHPITGLTASQYMSSEDASRVVSLLNTELSYYRGIGNELERITKLKGEINSLLSTPGISKHSRDELSWVLSGLNLREGLFGKQGVRDAFQSMNTDAYREQIQQALGVISRVNGEIRQGAKDSKAAQTENEKWAKSVDVAKQKIEDLKMKIASLEATKQRGDLLHVDTSSLSAYIAEMKNLLTIMRSIESGMKLHGTAESFASSAGYRNTWKLADAEAGVVNKNANEKEKAALATQRMNDAERQLAQSLRSTTNEMRGQSQMLSDLKMLATQYLGVWGAQGFLNNIIKIGGQLESQRLSLTAILGQRSYANDLFENIQDLALKSPFGVVQLDQYSKNLSAFGFQYNELFDMTKRLADIAAGTGTDFGRLALALGHVRSEMALTGYTLRQFSMANVPMLKMLAENLGVTPGEIRKMVREKKIGYDEVEKVLKDLTDEGGMFYNMQEVMSEAVSAKFKNLKDSMDIMYGQMAESVVGDMLKGIAAGLTEVTKRWETFGTVLLTTATLIGMYKLYMHLLNVGIQTNTVNLLQNTVATKTLTAADIEQMLEKKLLTAQDIALALAEGRLTVEQAKGALVAAGYTEAIVAEIAATRGLTGAMVGLKASSAGMLAMLTNPWTAALLAVEAVIGAVMAYKSWSDGIESDVDRVLERAKTASEEIGKYLKTSDKEGKPTEERDLSTEIEKMKTILENSELYTEELQNQVALAPSLSAEYDVLIGKMKEANANLTKMGVNTEVITEAIKASSTGDKSTDSWFRTIWMGTPSRMLFNDDINQNTEDLEKSLGAYQRLLAGMDSFRESMSAAMQTMVEDFGHVELANMPLEEQIRLLSSDEEAWNKFVSIVDGGSGKFVEIADDLRSSAHEVDMDWHEIVEDDVPRMMEKMAQMFGKTPDEFRKWANTHTDIFQSMLDTMLSAVKIASPQIAESLRNAILGWLGGMNQTNLYQREKTPEEIALEQKAEEEKRKIAALVKLGDAGRAALPKLMKANGGITGEWLSEYIDFNKNADDIEKEIVSAYKKAKGRAEAAKKLGRSTEEAENQSEADKLKAVMDYFGFKEKKDSKSSSKEDKDAKALRERVRILKEAADSYQYWREKVGDKGAESHVNEEFGKLLGEQGFKFENAEKFRKTLQELRKEYEKKPKTKAMLEALKELDKELAQLDRKDFEKGSEAYLSKMKTALDGLSRSWEIYKSVRESTGNVDLAESLSGRDDISTYRTLADVVKAHMIEDFKRLGVAKGLAFDVNLSDKEIEQEVFAAVPKQTSESVEAYEQRIKGLVEEYKKWRDLQRESEKSDLENFAKLIGSAVDLQSEVMKINQEFAETLSLLENLKSSGKITQSQYNKGFGIATANRDMKVVEAQAAYKLLMDGVTTITKQAAAKIKKDYVDALTKQLRTGSITAKDYADKISKINEAMRNLEYQKSDTTAYMQGGLNGVAQNKMERGRSLVEEGSQMYQDAQRILDMSSNQKEIANAFKNSDAGQNMMQIGEGMEAMGGSMMQTVAIIDMIVHGINDLVQGLKNTFDEIREMEEALGRDTNSDSWEDANTFFSSFSAASNSATKGWDSLKNGDAGGVIEGVVGSWTNWITGFAKGHDKKRQNHIEALQRNVAALEANTEVIKSLRSRMLGYDTGELRRYFAQTYKGGDAASNAMRDFYLKGYGATGYAQELADLEAQRQDYVKMYNEEDDKKKSSEEALLGFKQKIAELDEQIHYFTADLAKELWDIDIKGWADQLSDALCGAFENGESVAKAYHDTVTNILQSVMNKMMQMKIMEPMFSDLEDKLFGSSGVFNSKDPKGSAAAVISTVTDFFGKGGEGEETITAALEFMNAFERGLNNAGLSVKNTETANTLSSGIQGTSEETSDLLAAYVNALRQDVSINRILLTQFVAEMWPSYIEQVTSAVKSLGNIDQNVSFIRTLLSENGALYMMIDSMRSHLDNITNGHESISVK